MKNCPYCGEKIKTVATKCRYCKKMIPDIAVPAYSGNPTSQKITSKIVPAWKFILLSMITFGIYELVWFYRHWNFLKKERGLDISPFWRAFFAPIFAGNFAGHLKRYLNGENIVSNYSPALIGISYFIIGGLGRLPDPYWLLGMFTFIPLLQPLNAMNRYWIKKGDKTISIQQFKWWEIVLIILGIILLILVVVRSFTPE